MNRLTKSPSGRDMPTKKYMFSLPVKYREAFADFCESLAVGKLRARPVSYSLSECAATAMRLFMCASPDKARGMVENLHDDEFWRKIARYLNQPPDPGQ